MAMSAVAAVAAGAMMMPSPAMASEIEVRSYPKIQADYEASTTMRVKADLPQETIKVFCK